jgi:16S rRNA (cytidine1402-2'-O)-methyltransferase
MQCAAGHEGSGGDEKPALYVVATPIGNLRDITLRAIDVLKAVEVIAAEDTRVTGRLLSHYAIGPKTLLALHQHNERRGAMQVVEHLRGGRSVALTSDAGTPAFSDPGARLIAAVHEAGYRVIPVPGANAAAAALSVSGFAGPQFVFYGFLPSKGGERRSAIEAVSRLPYTLVFYEAPHRVRDMLADLSARLGGARTIVIARELTKMFESVHTGMLEDAAEWVSADVNRQKGEFVLIVEGAPAAQRSTLVESERVLEVLARALPVKQAASLAAQITGARKNELYARALDLKRLAEPQ